MIMWIIVSALCLASIAMALLPPAEPAGWEDLSAEEQAGSSRALVIAACLIAAFLGFVLSGLREPPRTATAHRTMQSRTHE